MKERSFDEMIAFFNSKVADMDISQDCKMELLGMVTALGYKHEKSVPQWIPCSERLPDKPDVYLISSEGISVTVAFFADGKWTTPTYLPLIGVDAWKPLDEPWRGEQT